jgi:cyclopropane-fatty-acyl-phospholipid synthase
MTGGAVIDQHAAVARSFAPALEALLGGDPPVRFEFWDGSSIGPTDSASVARVASPEAIRHMMWAPGELGLARAFVTGGFEIDGSLEEVLRTLQDQAGTERRMTPASAAAVFRAAREVGALGGPPPIPPEETVPRGWRHSIRRDKRAVSHHYDVGNDFYALVLGPSMTYSCARFADPTTSLEDAQAAKHELICRKLGLDEPGFRADCAAARPRLLDVGCGWGSMAIHAATHHDADVVGVTISEQQAELARRRVADAGLDDRVEIRLQDYREIADGPFDAISSVGMAEHVGLKNMDRYFQKLYDVLRPGGRILNHAIASVGGSKMGRRSFIARYVFPDGELLDIATTVASMERAGFEVRDVENLREHYAATLRHWVANLERRWDEAVGLVGVQRARVWRLYMSASVNGFLDGGIQIDQTLGVRSTGAPSGLPPTRAAWER